MATTFRPISGPIWPAARYLSSTAGSSRSPITRAVSLRSISIPAAISRSTSCSPIRATSRPQACMNHWASPPSTRPSASPSRSTSDAKPACPASPPPATSPRPSCPRSRWRHRRARWRVFLPSNRCWFESTDSVAVVYASRATKEIANMNGKYLVALVRLLPSVLAACNHATSSTDPRTQPALVRIETVEISAKSDRSFSGIVAARVQSDLGFRVPGKVLERLVDAGQTVKRGQALMRIDPKDLRLAMRAREEAVAAAKTRARQATDDEARYRHLVSANFVS